MALSKSAFALFQMVVSLLSASRAYCTNTKHAAVTRTNNNKTKQGKARQGKARR